MRLKKKEFLSLKQGGMSVAEYRDSFIELSRYAPEESRSASWRDWLDRFGTS
jgi:hypothetical protein